MSGVQAPIGQPLTGLRAMQRDWSVAWLLALREWLSGYRASRWNALWPVLYPVLYTSLLLAVRPLLGQQAHEPARYALFAFVGFSLWQAWIETLRAQLGALRRYKSMVARGDMGSGTIAISSAITAALQLIPRLLLAILLALVTRHDVDLLAILSLLAGGVLVIANATAIGTLLQSWATLTPGVDRTLQSVTLALIFTGGVFLPLPERPGALVQALLALNPFGALLDLARAQLLGDPLHSPVLVLAWIGVTVLAMLVARNLGPRLLPIVVERMGN